MMGKMAALTEESKGLADLKLDNGDLDAWVNIESHEGESSGSDWDSPCSSALSSPRVQSSKPKSTEVAHSSKVAITANASSKEAAGSEGKLAPSTPETTPHVVKPSVPAKPASSNPAPKPDFDLDTEYYPANLEAVQELAKDRTFRVTLKPTSPHTKPLQMFIGDAEGKALLQAFSGWNWHQQGCKRPLTYDFMKNVVESLGRKVAYVRICASERGVFYARAHFAAVAGRNPVLGDATLAGVDSRPSDALNLALRANVPIYVHRQLVSEAA